MTDERFLERLGEAIADLREKRSMSQMELARRLDTGNNQIRRIEKGLTGANIITLRNIARELDVPLKKLLDLEK